MKITLINTFHNTQINVLSKSLRNNYLADLNYEIYLNNSTKAKRQLAKIKKTLCGVSECQCFEMISEGN